jgi:hypothetical protein
VAIAEQAIARPENIMRPDFVAPIPDIEFIPARVLPRAAEFIFKISYL